MFYTCGWTIKQPDRIHSGWWTIQLLYRVAKWTWRSKWFFEPIVWSECEASSACVQSVGCLFCQWCAGVNLTIVSTRPNYQCRTAQLQKVQAVAGVVWEQHLHVERGRRQELHQCDDRLRATTTVVAASIEQSSTSHPFPLLELWLPSLTLESSASVAVTVCWLAPNDDLFFNSSITVVGLIFSTRAVSLMPLPLTAISLICCFTSAR